MRKLISAVVAAAALSSFGGFAQAESLEEKIYIIPSGEISQLCLADPLPSIGGNCFDVSADGSVHVRIWDSVNLDAASFDVRFYGAAGGIGGRLPGCNEGSFEVPEGAQMMRVFIGLTNASTNCDVTPNLPAVGGSIFVTHGGRAV